MINVSQQVKFRRVFLALWPDDTLRKQLVERFAISPQSALQGRIFKSSNLHLTLHFLGNLTQHQLDCVLEVASKIRLSSFDLQLDRYGYFKKSRVFWTGPGRVAEGLCELHTELAKKLVSCGYHAEKHAFTPHVTLMRKLTTAGKLIVPESVSWHIHRFALIESLPAKKTLEYTPLKFFNLI